jgi:outer membrane lipoprotein SlyB
MLTEAEWGVARMALSSSLALSGSGQGQSLCALLGAITTSIAGSHHGTFTHPWKERIF